MKSFLFDKLPSSKQGFSKHSGEDIGQAAEHWACRHLTKAGLEILATNYRAPQGEIDIVAMAKTKSGIATIFVEVRLRTDHRYGKASDSINSAKQQRIIRAATHYLQQHGIWDKAVCRFDTICIDWHTDTRQYQLEWTPNAFSSD